MTPMLIHRYSIPALDAVRALFDVGDCDEIQVVMVGENLVVDVIEPVGRRMVADAPSIEPQDETAEPERKGGDLAKKAGILCNEKAFQVWAEVNTPDAAKAFIYKKCGVESRIDLDHEEEPGAIFKALCLEYQVWLDTPDYG